MKIYSILVEHTNFEDEDNNYSELDANSYVNKEEAIKGCDKQLLDCLYSDMVYYGNKEKDLTKDWEYRQGKVSSDINEFGYLALEQENGYGETRIILQESILIK
jgi:hypothetical protein